MHPYRSGLRFRPPLALGGHAFVLAPPPPGDLDGLPECPGVWRCTRCHVLVPDYLQREGFYPRPCMGGVAALAPGVTGTPRGPRRGPAPTAARAPRVTVTPPR